MDGHRLFLGLGSNLGDKQRNIELAYFEINKRIGKVISQSAFYVSKPQGFDSNNEFLNTVCEVDTNLNAREILEEIFVIEKIVGRTSKSLNGVYSDRLIDIDILMYDNTVTYMEDLVIPHPRLHQRDFVLIPFAEISPKTVHPILKKTIAELNNQLVNDSLALD